MRRGVIISICLLFAGCTAGQNGNGANGLLKEPDSYDNPTVATWARNLKDDDPNVRLEAAQQLADMGPDAREAVPVLNNALADADPRVRATAAYALGRIGPDAKDAIPGLVDTMNDQNRAVRRAAILALPYINGVRQPPPSTS
jgi:HEAT repeat protein